MMSGVLSIHILTILSGLFNDIVWRRRVEQVWLMISVRNRWMSEPGMIHWEEMELTS